MENMFIWGNLCLYKCQRWYGKHVFLHILHQFCNICNTYMCICGVLCVERVFHMYLLYMYYPCISTCNKCVGYTQVYINPCNTCVNYTPILHAWNVYSHVIYTYYRCIAYMCNTPKNTIHIQYSFFFSFFLIVFCHSCFLWRPIVSIQSYTVFHIYHPCNTHAAHLLVCEHMSWNIYHMCSINDICEKRV